MITENQIADLVAEKLKETEYFVVDIRVGPGNRIEVELDGDEGIPILDYDQFSRHIEGSLDREIEDYSLQVSSPGLDRTFKVFRQYTKNIGRDVKVKLNDGVKHVGKLIRASETEIELEKRSMERLEKKKKKVEVVKNVILAMDSINKIKVKLDF
jgi:ribosome maturation factor RimP